ncbi:MAG TPA: hypothetical protein VIS76_00915 [Pseudomonadales bacterium]
MSDLPAEEQRRLLELLGRFGPVAEPFLPGTRISQTAVLKIVVFSRRSDFRALTGTRKFAAFMQPSLQTNRLLVGPVRDSLTETTLHEYAHHLLRSRQDVSLPLWFDEGLASLLGHTEFDDTSASIGDLPLARMRTRANEPLAGLAPTSMMKRTLAATTVRDWHQTHIDAFYDWSWLLAHYLLLDQLDGAAVNGTALETFLHERSSSLPGHLGETPASLTRRLQRYVNSPARPLQRPSPPAPAVHPNHACLTPFERDHELARAVLEQNPAGALNLIAPHLADRPDDVALLITRGRVALASEQLETAESFANAALAAEPDNAAATILKADLTAWNCLFEITPDCRTRWQQARDLYQRALRRDPTRFDGVLGLGLAYLYTGRPGEAVNYIRVAYARAPWAALVNYYLGESYRLIGDTRAYDYLLNARNWADLPVWRLLAEESLRRLDSPAADSSDLQ